MDWRLPTSGTIPDDAWRRRHHGITLLLWAHAVVIPSYAVARGFSVPHALLVSAGIPALAIGANRPGLSKRARMITSSLGLLLCSTLLIHLSDGLIEMHFHFFVAIIVISLYQDWLTVLLAVGFVLFHHGVVGVISPRSVYNHPAAIEHPWRFAAIHSGFVAAASIAALVNWRLNERHLQAAALAEHRLNREIRMAECLSAAETALTVNLDLDHVAQTLVDEVIPLASAEYGTFVYRSTGATSDDHLLSISSGGARTVTKISAGSCDAIRFGPTLDAGTMLRTEDLADTDVNASVLWPGVQLGSMFSVPITLGTDAFGALVIADRVAGKFDSSVERAVVGLAAHASVVMENVRLYRAQQTVALTLQQSMLPDVLPTVAGLTVAARYHPADIRFDVGGDWYDVFHLPDGSLGLVMGDVVGHGLPAASLMSQMRNTLRAYALDGCSPGSALTRLNTMACALDLGYVATVVFVALDPPSGVGRIASAGHPPPLLVGNDRTAEYLKSAGGPALGWLDHAEYGEFVVELRPGCSILLYTDGLIEDRSITFDDGLERLRHAACEIAAGPEEMCEYVSAHGASAATSPDDIAILVVRRDLIDEPVDVESPLPKTPGVLA